MLPVFVSQVGITSENGSSPLTITQDSELLGTNHLLYTLRHRTEYKKIGFLSGTLLRSFQTLKVKCYTDLMLGLEVH